MLVLTTSDQLLYNKYTTREHRAKVGMMEIFLSPLSLSEILLLQYGVPHANQASLLFTRLAYVVIGLVLS